MFSRNSISDLTLGDNIEIIGEGAFENNPLTNVSFGHGIKTIGNSSFAYTLLKNITLPYSVTNTGSPLLMAAVILLRRSVLCVAA